MSEREKLLEAACKLAAAVIEAHRVAVGNPDLRRDGTVYGALLAAIESGDGK
jgi:hypothetical protein